MEILVTSVTKNYEATALLGPVMQVNEAILEIHISNNTPTSAFILTGIAN
jgi:hypothetical protein